MENIPSVEINRNNEHEKEKETEKEGKLTIIQRSLLLKEPEKIRKIVQSIVVFMSYLIMGMARTAQGPCLLDLKDQVKVTLEDFKLIFSIGSFTFPFGNFVGAFIIKYFKPLRFVALSMVIFAVTNTYVALTSSFYTLVAIYGINELIMGIIDSACNIAIFKIWGRESDPYFTALHFCLGIGNLLGPIFAEIFLTDDQMAEDQVFGLSGNTSSPSSALFSISSNFSENNYSTPLISDSVSVLPPVEYDMWKTLFHSMSLTELQTFHWFMGIFIMGTGFFTTLASFLPVNSSTVENPSSSTSCGNFKSYMKNNYLYMLLVGAMTVFAFCGNGIYFLIGNFITVHGMNSPLRMSKSEGARTTAIFFAASVVSKFLAIFAVDLIKNTFILMLINLFVLSLGSWFLLTVGDTSMLLYRIGMAIVGLGIGTHFSIGALWLTKIRQLSDFTTSILLISTSVGAQFFKIPASKYITTFPSLFYYIILGSWAAIVVSIIVSKLLAIRIWRTRRDNIMNRHVIRRCSDTTSSESIDEA